jgi:RND superfamily putative drug exporter
VHTIARLITARRWAALVALLAILGSALVIALAGPAERSPRAGEDLPAGSGSARALELGARLEDSDAKAAIVLFARDQGLSPAHLQLAGERVAELPGGSDAPVIPSKDGTAAIGIVEVDKPDATGVAEAVAQIRDSVRADLPAGLTVQVTGPAAIQADLAAVFDGANVRLLLATASVVAILLVITYRSPVLWLVPLTVVGVADQLAGVLATRTLAAVDVAWDESTVGILSVLVFGAGTDYALLLISRYRDELRREADRRSAMAQAVTRTAEAITASSVTVFVGLLTLLLSLFPATRGLGLACAVGVVVAAAFVMVVLPAALVVFGRWVFWPRVPQVGQAPIVDSRSVWRRIGDAVARRPAAYAGVVVAILAIFAANLTQITTGLSDADQFLRKPEAIAAAERLARSFPAGSADPTRIVTTAPVPDVLARVTAVPGVESARPGASAGSVGVVEAVLSAPPGSDRARASVVDLRAALDDLPSTYVGGTEAAAVDRAAATSRDRLVIIPLILALVLLALIMLLRSLVAPVILVATVVMTYLSSLGISWLLFTQVFGFARLDEGVPLLAFVFLVALGVDYNIFLVTRAREEARRHGAREGMLRDLRRRVASSPAPAFCWPPSSPSSACCRWSFWRNSASSSASVSSWTPWSSGRSWCPPSDSSSATASGGRVTSATKSPLWVHPPGNRPRI